jgi:hypothetical protein
VATHLPQDHLQLGDRGSTGWPMLVGNTVTRRALCTREGFSLASGTGTDLHVKRDLGSMFGSAIDSQCELKSLPFLVPRFFFFFFSFLNEAIKLEIFKLGSLEPLGLYGSSR